MSLRDQLNDVYARHGRLTPSVLVSVAQPAEHPLHGRFEWDDQVAGHNWRKKQARDLIRSVRVKYREPSEDDDGTIRAFYAVRTDDGERSYRPVNEVVQDEFLTELVRQDMKREWRALRRRYEAFDEFWALVKEEAEDRDERIAS